MGNSNGLLPAIIAWLEVEPSVKAAVLFGSRAASNREGSSTGFSDIDIHIVTSAAKRFETLDWAKILPHERFCLRIARPATGGVRKVTVLLVGAQIDLVLVPAAGFNLVRIAAYLGMHQRIKGLRIALNEVHTCIQSGYSFLKGQAKWGKFYAWIMREMPGVRLSNEEILELGGIFLCDMYWIMQKLEGGEILASQHAIHRSLADINFRLIRELRLRQNKSLPSFGIARHAEILLQDKELAWVRVDAKLDCEELRRSAWNVYNGFKALMTELVPTWVIPSEMEELLASYASVDK